MDSLHPIAFRSLFLLLLTSCGIGSPPDPGDSKLASAQPNDAGTRLIRVTDTSVSPPLRKIMLVSGGRGYYVDTNAASCRVLGGFGFNQVSFENLPIWQLNSPDMLSAKPLNQPLLRCFGDDALQSNQIRAVRVLAEAGKVPRYFYMFHGSAQDNKYYELGCQGLFAAFARSPDEALPIHATALTDAALVAELSCSSGQAFSMPVVTGTLADWCLRPNLNAADQETLNVLLQDAGESDCHKAEAALRRKHPDDRLVLSNKYISSLGPLESLTWLRELDLSGNYLTDITAVSRLNKLVSLNVKDNAITSIEPLASLSLLRTLDLENNDINSVAPLRLLRYLEKSNMKSNLHLRPLDPNSTFLDTCLMRTAMTPSARRTVDAVLDRISTTRCVQAAEILAGTATLDLSNINPPLDDISPLMSLRDFPLTTLNLDGNAFSDARPLQHLRGLTRLSLNSGSIDGEQCPYEAGPQVLQDFCHGRAQTFIHWCMNPQLSGSANQTVRLLRETSGLPQASCQDVFDRLKTQTDFNLYDSNFQLTDLRPLRGLRAIKNLTISSGVVSDLGPVRYLSQLETLRVGSELVTSLEPLRHLQNLRVIDFESSSVADLSPLASLRNLTVLSLPWADIQDVTPLSGLTQLTRLNLQGNPLQSLQGLQLLTELEALDLSGKQLTDPAPLTNMKRLRFLTLYDTNFSSLLALRGMAVLEYLQISGGSIPSLDGLQGKPLLSSFSLSQSLVTDLSPLADSIGLQHLAVMKSPIQSLEGLRNLPNLQAISFSGRTLPIPGTTPLDLSPLQNLQDLKNVDLSSLPLSSLEPLRNKPYLTSLTLTDAGLTDIGPLSGLPALSYLDLSRNDISFLHPLSSLRNMATFYGQDCGVNPLSTLECPNKTQNQALNHFCRDAVRPKYWWQELAKGKP